MQPLVTRQIELSNQTITLNVPADPEQLLEDAAEANGHDDPYWGILWSAAERTAECVANADWAPGLTALELGCGLGLVGIAGLKAGLSVTFSDRVSEAVELSTRNAAVNGFSNAKGCVIDWSDDDDTDEGPEFDVLLASDILYDSDSHVPVLKFAQRVLKAGGCFWIGDPGRQNAASFVTLAEDRGWKVELRDSNLQVITAPHVATFQLLTLRIAES